MDGEDAVRPLRMNEADETVPREYVIMVSRSIIKTQGTPNVLFSKLAACMDPNLFHFASGQTIGNLD